MCGRSCDSGRHTSTCCSRRKVISYLTPRERQWLVCVIECCQLLRFREYYATSRSAVGYDTEQNRLDEALRSTPTSGFSIGREIICDRQPRSVRSRSHTTGGDTPPMRPHVLCSPPLAYASILPRLGGLMYSLSRLCMIFVMAASERQPQSGAILRSS